MRKLMYIAAALLVLAGCSNKEEVNGIQNEPSNYGTIIGKIELPQDEDAKAGARKINAPEGWEAEVNPFTMVWEASDAIYIYNGSECKQLSLKSVDNAGIATFEGELLSDMSEYKVAYGYNPQSTSTDYTVPYVEGNYRPFANGEGENYNFTINNFGPVIGLPLKGTDALSKIEVVLLDNAEKTMATYTMTFATALALNTTTATKVYFPIQDKKDATRMCIHFYKKEDSQDVMIMSKATKNMPAASKVTTFPELTMNPANGHVYVDLGLPSGLKWATMNVGATTPEGYGDYFAWGEKEPYYNTPITDPISWKTGKTGYNWQSYCGQSSFSEWSTAPYDATTKILKPEFDAATANWGGSWRMPTKEELDELIANCTWTWTTNYNGTGIKGYIVEGNTNSIFLPASGCRMTSSSYGVGSYGRYWSSSLYEGKSSDAYGPYFASGTKNLSNYNRNTGHSVRAVCQ